MIFQKMGLGRGQGGIGGGGGGGGQGYDIDQGKKDLLISLICISLLSQNSNKTD